MDNRTRLCICLPATKRDGRGCHLRDGGSCSMACLSVVSENFGKHEPASGGVLMLRVYAKFL